MEVSPPESPVFVSFERLDPNPRAGIPFIEAVTPETVFCIGFNKAFSSSFRAVAILLYSIFSSPFFFLRVLEEALGPFSGSKEIDL